MKRGALRVQKFFAFADRDDEDRSKYSTTLAQQKER